jgi:hypothetical protein
MDKISKTANYPSVTKFHVPLSGSVALPHPAYVVMTEDEARRLVVAIDNCWPSDVMAIIQRQPWFKDIRAGVRTTRHLKPNDYLELSKR